VFRLAGDIMEWLAYSVKELVTMHHLSKLVTDSVKLTIEDRVSCLIKLHHVLEMTVMLQQSLNLPQNLLSTAARSLLMSSFGIIRFFVHKCTIKMIRQLIACTVSSRMYMKLQRSIFFSWWMWWDGNLRTKKLSGGMLVLAWLSVRGEVQICIWPSWC